MPHRNRPDDPDSLLGRALAAGHAVPVRSEGGVIPRGTVLGWYLPVLHVFKPPAGLLADPPDNLT